MTPVVVSNVLNMFAFFRVLGDVTDPESRPSPLPTQAPGTGNTPTDQGSRDDENSDNDSGMYYYTYLMYTHTLAMQYMTCTIE